jgi:hypothetical protein
MKCEKLTDKIIIKNDSDEIIRTLDFTSSFKCVYSKNLLLDMLDFMNSKRIDTIYIEHGQSSGMGGDLWMSDSWEGKQFELDDFDSF